MSETLGLDGFCPSTSDDTRVQPNFDDDEDQFVCPDCGMGLGADETEARNRFRKHALKVGNA